MAEVEVHRPHKEERAKQRLQDCINMDAGRAPKTGMTKEREEEDSRERGGESWMEDLKRGVH